MTAVGRFGSPSAAIVVSWCNWTSAFVHFDLFFCAVGKNRWRFTLAAYRGIIEWNVSHKFRVHILLLADLDGPSEQTTGLNSAYDQHQIRRV